jgi:hypothetical protein
LLIDPGGTISSYRAGNEADGNSGVVGGEVLGRDDALEKEWEKEKKTKEKSGKARESEI